jgi:hypothetical protein
LPSAMLQNESTSFSIKSNKVKLLFVQSKTVEYGQFHIVGLTLDNGLFEDSYYLSP